jgi:hypothetical protein
MCAMMIGWSLENFGLLLFVAAMLLIILQWSTNHTISTVEIYYRWISLLPLGVSEIYAFIMHTFFPSLAASTIGWAASPFQYEVGMANLGFGVIAILSFKASYGFRFATVVATTCWLWGNALGHIYQMITHHNFRPGNAGSWFWMDIVIPIILLICISRMKPGRVHVNPFA